MALKGNAGFKFTPPGGSLTTLALAWPLRNLRPATFRSRFAAWSLDGTEREVLVVGDGCAEIVADIRFGPNGAAILEMLDAGASGAALTYYPDLDVTGTNYPAHLVSPDADAVEAMRDRDRWMRGEYEATVRLRRTDGGTFDALL